MLPKLVHNKINEIKYLNLKLSNKNNIMKTEI
jgi:hypothetical protein